jgi:hypothetical protein
VVLDGFGLHYAKLTVTLFFLEKGLADVMDSGFLLSNFVALDFLFLEVFVIEPEFDDFFHHEYFGKHMGIVNFIDLIAHQYRLFVRLVVELGDLVNSLLGFLDVVLVVFIFLLVVVNGFGEMLFLFVELLELVDANISTKSGFDKTGLKLLKNSALVIVDSLKELFSARCKFHE